MLSELVATVFPAACPGCGARAEPICRACRSRIRSAPRGPTPAGLDALHIPFAYEGVVRELVARAKYRDRHAALTWLAEEIVAVLPTDGDAVGVVTWAPTTPARRRRRGFDQAELLAVRIGAAIDRPVRAGLRRASRGHQTGADRAARAAGPLFVPTGGARSVGSGGILLVDDVVTTGATMQAAARALRIRPATVILGAAVARTP